MANSSVLELELFAGCRVCAGVQTLTSRIALLTASAVNP